MIQFFWDRMAPLSPLQKKVYVSILRKELPKLIALASGASNAQSVHNIVSRFLLNVAAMVLVHHIIILINSNCHSIRSLMQVKFLILL